MKAYNFNGIDIGGEYLAAEDGGMLFLALGTWIMG